MKNPIIIVAIIVVIAVVGLGAYAFSQNSSKSQSTMKDDAMMKEETSMEPKDAMMKKDEMAMEGDKMMDGGKDSSANKMADSRYIQYSKSALDNASDSRRVLFFYASWCPTCRPADQNFTQNIDKIPEDVTLIRVNYNDPDTDQEEKDLAKKYTVTYQHTFVQIDGTGKEITKWNGGQMDELLSNIK